MIVDPAVSYQYEWFCVLVRKWLGVSKEGSIQSCSARRCSVRPARQPAYTHPIVVTLTLACGDQGEATHVSHVRQMTMYGTERTIHLLAASVCGMHFNSLSTFVLCIHHPIKHVLHVWYWLYEVFPALEAAGLIIKHLPRNYIRTTLMSSTIRNCPDSDSMQEKK